MTEINKREDLKYSLIQSLNNFPSLSDILNYRNIPRRRRVVMNKYLNLCMGLFLGLFALESYALQISVQTSSKEVYALGFKEVSTGKKFGGSGTSYSKSGLNPGKYKFGIRVGGLLINYKEYGCYYKGSDSVMIKGNASAVLRFNGHACTASVYQSR
jgi:hypothetical protein